MAGRAKRKNPPVSQELENEIRDGMARYLWITAYADWAEEHDVPRAKNGQDWDDVAPETPRVAMFAANDLCELFAIDEGITDSKAVMSTLFELAYHVEQGEELQYDELGAPYDKRLRLEWRKGEQGARIRAVMQVKIDDAPTILEMARRFGGDMAAQALGQGVGWDDDHKVKSDDGRIEFKPKVPHFECYFVDDVLEWSGSGRTGAYPDNRRHGSMSTSRNQVGGIDIINPDEGAYAQHRYLVIGGWGLMMQVLMVYADDQETALNLVADHIRLENTPERRKKDPSLLEPGEEIRILEQDPDVFRLRALGDQVNEHRRERRKGRSHRILQIDAWADGSSWTWNNWYEIGTVESVTLETLNSDEKLLAFMRDRGYMGDNATTARVEIEDDGNNIVFSDRDAIDAPENCDNDDCSEHAHTARPIFAIEIGEDV